MKRYPGPERRHRGFVVSASPGCAGGFVGRWASSCGEEGTTLPCATATLAYDTACKVVDQMCQRELEQLISTLYEEKPH